MGTTSPCMEPDLALRGISISRSGRRADIAGSAGHRWKKSISAPTRGAVWGRVVEAWRALQAEAPLPGEAVAPPNEAA